MNAQPTELLLQAQQLSESVTRPIPGSRQLGKRNHGVTGLRGN